MTPRVLILSGLYDFSTDLVVLELARRGVPYLRVNREHLSEHLFALDPIAEELRVTGPSGQSIVGPDLASVWFRQPVFLRNTPSTPLSPYDQLERSQWTAFMRALCVFQNAHWVNHPAATYIAESKPYQLSVASRCGFQVPKTFATNDVSIVHTEFPDHLVVKSLDTVLLRDGDDCLFTYTTVANGSTLSAAEVKPVPMLVQMYLRNKSDLRVTVIGSTIFAVRILSNGEGIVGDWRTLPKERLQYVDMELDEETKKSCFALTSALNLSFAAIDLLETPRGIFFVEINPTGEWGWLSKKDRRIDVTIASALAYP